ncbi:MAG: hypothetical protein E7599_01210 [Ruminococcaceae bacterium]|nr:hypothetical protein [Oscillospiraceae bacterium]
MNKKYKEYAGIALQAVVIFLLYGYVITFADEYVHDTLYRLNIPQKTRWMFLLVEVFSVYAGIVVPWKLVLQRSRTRKRLLAGVLPSDLTLSDAARDILRFPLFWIETLAILLPATYWPPVRHTLCEMIGLETDLVVLQYITAVLLFVLPMLAVYLYVEAKQRREWAQEWYHLDEGKLRRFREGELYEKKYYVKLAFNVLLYVLAMLMLPTVMTYLMAALNSLSAFAVILPQILIIAAVIVVCWFVGRLWRAMRRRKRFIKEIQSACDKYRFKFTYQFTFRSLFTCSCKTEFTVKTPKKTFTGCLLPVPGNTSKVYFSPYEDSYRMMRRILVVFYLMFPRHKLDLSALGNPGDGAERVIVLTRRPSGWVYGTEKGGQELDNGSVFGGKSGKVTLYEIEGFISAVEMEGIGRRTDLWQ